MTELVMPNAALWGIGLQQGAGATEQAKLIAGYDQVVAEANMHYFALTTLGFAPVKNVDNIPTEIGGRALTSGAFTAGVWAEGGVSMVPRMDDQFGWLLYAGLGQASTISDMKAEDLAICGGDGVTTTAGVNSHIFMLPLDNNHFLPWLTIHRLLPHATAGERVGEIAQDGHVRTLTITGAAAQPVTADIDIVARVKQTNYVFNIDPETNLSWSPTYDEFDAFGVTSCEGHVRINSVDYQARSASMVFTNQNLAPAQSLIIGSVHPQDFPNLGKQVQITFTFLVDTYDLYLSTFVGTTVDASASSGENVTCVVFLQDVDILFASQIAIGAAGDATEVHKLRLVSGYGLDNVDWQIRPLVITPGRPVEIQATGMIQATDIDEGSPFFLILQNGQTNYALP
jgi:hypothetical protein